MSESATSYLDGAFYPIHGHTAVSGCFFCDDDSNHGCDANSVPVPTAANYTDTVHSADIGKAPASSPSSHAYLGYLKITEQRTLKFSLESDDGAVAKICTGLDSNAQPVFVTLNNNGNHPLAGVVSEPILFKPGYYQIIVLQFDQGNPNNNYNALKFSYNLGKEDQSGLGKYTGNTGTSSLSSWIEVPIYAVQSGSTSLLANQLLKVGATGKAWIYRSESDTKSYSVTSADEDILTVGTQSSTNEWPITGVSAGTIDVELRENQSSTQEVLDVCPVMVIEDDFKPENECACQCAEGTQIGNECVSFSVAFGSSPHLSGAPRGRLVIQGTNYSEDLFTPSVLRFEHPVMRKMLRHANGQTLIHSGRNRYTTYESGRTSEYSSGTNGGAYEQENGTVREILTDGSALAYDSSGAFEELTTFDGVVCSTLNLGIDVIKDAAGAIRQIWAAAEGLLDVTTGTDSFVISWYKNADVTGKDSTTGLYTFSGSPIKTFTVEKPAGTTNVVRLTERRGVSFEFIYTWTYIPANSDWTLVRGTGETTSTLVRNRAFDQDGNAVFTNTLSSGNSTPIVTTETVSSTAQGNRFIGRTRGGVSYLSADRDSSENAGGQIASAADRSGGITSYEYDSFGRTLKVSSPGFGGLTKIVRYEYPANSRNGVTDTRPSKITEQLKNTSTNQITTLSVTEYEYNDDTTAGRTEAVTQTVNGVSQVTKRCWWPVSNTVESGRLMSELRPDGTMTFYEYSATGIETLDITNYANYTYTETITEGIASNSSADHYFGIAVNKSTRKINTYDAAGNIVRTENYIHCNSAFRLISSEEHTYNPMHKVIASTYSNGKTSSADWICTGPVFEIDTDGIRTDYTYDALKRCTSKVRHSPNGDITTSYTYDAEGRVLSTNVSGGSGDNFVSETTSHTYDSEGRIATQTDARGLVTSFAYSTDNLTTTETRPNGGTVVTVRNLDGTTASVTGSAVTPVFYTYMLDAVAGLEIMEERYGTSTSKRWKKTYTNKFGQTVKIEESAWNETVKTTINTYNAKGQLVSTASTNAPMVTYLYDNTGNVSQETVSDGETERIVTHAYQHVGYASTQWAMRRQDISKCSDTTIPQNTAYLFTQLSGFSNDLEQKTESKNVRSLSTLDWSSFDSTTKVRTVRHTEPGANTGTTTLVRDGLTLSETDAAGVTTTYTYDALGRQLTATNGRGNTTTNVYNALGQLVSTTDAANHTTTYTYSATTGELVTVTDANGKTVNYVYDLKGRKIAEYGTATYPVSFEYNVFGEMVKLFTYRNPNAVIVTNPDPDDGDQMLWTYDESSGLLASKTYADNKTVSYTYDVKGQLLTHTWARTMTEEQEGVEMEVPLVTTYAYNVYGELLSVTYSDGTTPDVTNTYNAMGMLTSTTDVSGENTKTYTTYRELATESNAVLGTSLAIGRDTYGRETSSTLTQGETALATTATQYNNNNGRITRGTFGTNQFNYTYLANSHLLSQVTTCGGAAKKVFTYETTRDFPTEIAFKLTNNTLIAKRNYTFDALGRVATRTQTRGAAARNDSFGYNDRSELTSASLGTNDYAYNFDNIGNRITAEELADEINYTANNLNQYTAIEKNSGTPFVPTFDDDGNQLTVQTATGVWNVTYNAENRPVTFTNGTTLIECKYDAQGRRFEKKVTANETVTFWQRYAYKGYLQIAAFNVTTEIADEVETEVLSPATTTYWDPTEPTATRPLAFTDHAGETPATYFYTHDLTKNVCEVLSHDGSAVEIVTTYDYTPFGAVTASNSATQNTFMFSSEVLDPETSLVYYNYRHYNPIDGRWISRDPIAEQGGWNLYNISHNNLMLLFDSYGMYDEKACNSDIAAAQRTNKKIKESIEQLKKQKCIVPIKCECCSYLGYYSPTTKSITICYDQQDSATSTITTLAHELNHAVDLCTKSLPLTCEDYACTEIKSYDRDGACAKGEASYDPKVSYRECVKRGATNSVKTITKCTANARAYVDKMFNKCFYKK